MLFELPFRVCGEKASPAPEANVFTDLVLERIPDAKAFLHHRDFACVATLYPDPSPVSPGLLPRYVAFFAQNSAYSGPGKKPRCRNANNSAAYNDNVGGSGHR